MTQRIRLLTAVYATALSLALLPGTVMAGNGNGKSSGHSNDSGSHGQSESHASNGTAHTSAKPLKTLSTSVAARGADGGDADRGGNHGAVASELKGMNSSHASLVALEHASPDSRVGKNAAYLAAAQATEAAEATRHDARVSLFGAAVQLRQANLAVDAATQTLTDANAALQAAIDAGLDTTAAQAQVDAATTALTDAQTAQQTAHDAARTAAVEAIQAGEAYRAAAEAEEEALMVASDGRPLSDDALQEYRSNLGL